MRGPRNQENLKLYTPIFAIFGCLFLVVFESTTLCAPDVSRICLYLEYQKSWRRLKLPTSQLFFQKKKLRHLAYVFKMWFFSEGFPYFLGASLGQNGSVLGSFYSVFGVGDFKKIEIGAQKYSFLKVFAVKTIVVVGVWTSYSTKVEHTLSLQDVRITSL